MILKNTFMISLIIILVGGSIPACILKPPNDNIKRITAMEKISDANNIAQNWNNTSFLFYIRSNEGINNNGKALKWRYCYLTNPENKSLTMQLDVVISSNGSVTIYQKINPIIINPILNWTIDSDSAIKVAKSDDRINHFLSKYPEAKIEEIGILSGQYRGCVINIQWVYYSTSPIPLKIQMDGNTGVIIDIE